MTPLAAASLAGGTITGDTYAVKYSGQIKSTNEATTQAQRDAHNKKLRL